MTDQKKPITSRWKIAFAVILTFVFLGEISIFLISRYYILPQYESELIVGEKKVSELQATMNTLYVDSGIDEVLQEYEMEAEKIQAFYDARRDVFIYGDDEDYDFFPPMTELVIPSIKRHLHNDVTLEGISINEKGEIIMPIFADNYTALSKQYAAIKAIFDEEEYPLLTNIKLNAFTSQEIEIIERDARRRLFKTRKKVSKATIVALLNPDYFIPGGDPDFEGMFDFNKDKNEKKGVWKKTKHFFGTIWTNIVKDFTGKDISKPKLEIEDEVVLPIKTQRDLSETVNEYYEIKNSETGQDLEIEQLEGDLVTYSLINDLGVGLYPEEMINEDGSVRNVVYIGESDEEGYFYFNLKEESFQVISNVYQVILEEQTITIKEKSKEIVTNEIPPFFFNGATWNLVPSKMSEFLAAGKIIKAEEFEISPYETYELEGLHEIARNMIQRVIDKSPTSSVSFQKRTYDMQAYGTEVSLIELNNLQ